MLELKNINIIYDKKECIRNGDFKAVSGNITGIYGESGTGKSSLLYVIGMLSQQKCDYYYNNELLEYNDKQKAKFRKEHISFITQNSVLVETISVEKNIEFFLSMSNTEYSVEELLEMVNLTDKKNVIPSSLSGGEKQRVAIACAIAKDSDIILGDEITSALDEDNKNIIMNLLRECANKGKIVILVSHEKKVLDECDVLYKIDHLELILEKEKINNVPNFSKADSKRIVHVLSLFELLFDSDKRRKLIYSFLVMLSLLTGTSILNQGIYNIYNIDANSDTVLNTKLTVFNDELQKRRTQDNKTVYAYTINYPDRPIYESDLTKLKQIDNIDEIYDNYHLYSKGINKYGKSYRSDITVKREGKEIRKKEFSEETNYSYDYYIKQSYPKESIYSKHNNEVYINKNMAYVYNIEVGDYLEFDLNVPYAMTANKNIDEKTGKEYYTYSLLTEKVTYSAKVVGISNIYTEDNEIYINYSFVMKMIKETVNRYNNGEINVDETAFYESIENLKPFSQTVVVNEYENVLKVQNEINSISENIYSYSEYQNVLNFIEKIEKTALISAIISMVGMSIFIIGSIIMCALYCKKQESLKMNLRLIGYSDTKQNKLFVLNGLWQVLCILFMSMFIYIVASLPDILLMFGNMSIEEVYSYMNDFTNIIYSYFSFTPMHFAIFAVSVILTVSISNYLVIRYFNKLDITKWLRGD